MNDEYRRTFQGTVTLRGQSLIVVAKPGLPGGAAIGSAVALCAKLIGPASDERVILLGCGNGALAVVLARLLPTGRLAIHDPHLIALRMAALTLAANSVSGVAIDEQICRLPAEAGAYDRVVILAPQSRALGRRWLVEAHGLLRPGGVLTLAGANTEGIQSLITDAAALFGGAHTLGYGGGARVAEALRLAAASPAPLWASEPGIVPSSWATVHATLPTGPYTLASLPGVFSADRLDAGTAFLLQHVTFAPSLQVLDAGCGYGPLGIAAALAGAAPVTMLDVNLLAVAAAAENIRRLELGSQAAALAGDGLEAAQGAYDLIVSNPPFHAGREVDTTMANAFFVQARALLKPHGSLVLVANSFLAYERQLAPHFAQVETIAANRAYKVLQATAR